MNHEILALRRRIGTALRLQQDASHRRNHEQRISEPVPVLAARLRQSSGTTLLALSAAVRISEGDDISILSAEGIESVRVRGAAGRTIEVAGLHADATHVAGRSVHGDQVLLARLERAWRSPSSLFLAAAGLRKPRSGVADPAQEALLDGLEADQVDALRAGLGSELLLAMGPPGTGKTETLARTIAALLARGERVLLLSQTHAAVDVALARIRRTACQRADVPQQALLRQGRHGPAWSGTSLEGAHREGLQALLTEITTRAARLGGGAWGWAWNLATTLGVPDDAGIRLNQIEQRCQTLLREDSDRIDARAILRDVRRLRRAWTAASRPPQLVAATLAEAVLRPPVGPWDTVVVDEGSTADVAHSLFAASLGAKRLLVWGDPRQLGPVCESEVPEIREVLARSLFAHLGLESPLSEDPRRATLRRQHRMAPAIRRVVSGCWYDDILEDGPAVRDRSAEIHIEDTGGQHSARAEGSSRVNDGHARLVAERAAALWSRGTREIAALTPYRAQVERLRAEITSRIPAFEAHGGWIGTIHSAQGNERDAVLLDLVVSRDRPGRFIDDRTSPETSALLCVAFSRARHHLSVFVDTGALPAGGIAARAVAAGYRETRRAA